jgi:hypothetical protein
MNETVRTAAAESCRAQLQTMCLVFAANGQVEGNCRMLLRDE